MESSPLSQPGKLKHREKAGEVGQVIESLECQTQGPRIYSVGNGRQLAVLILELK